MLMQRISYSQAASTVTPNILAGTTVEFIGKASVLELFGAAFLAAATDSTALSYTVGGDSRVMIPAGTALNINAAGPQTLNDKLLDAFPVPLGSHLIMPLTSDATVGTHTGRLMVGVGP
jgi:hypothetical protein